MFENEIDQFYGHLMVEHSRLLGELKNMETFNEKNKQHTLITTVMKDLLKLKHYKEKLKSKDIV